MQIRYFTDTSGKKDIQSYLHNLYITLLSDLEIIKIDVLSQKFSACTSKSAKRIYKKYGLNYALK